MKLKSVELVNALSAEFEQLNVLTQTSVNINQNVVEAELGNFVLFAAFLDVFHIADGSRPTDQLVFDFFKTLVDDAAIADVATTGVIKVFNDAGYATDSERIQFAKHAFETITTSDPYYFEFAKALNDSVSGIGDQAILFAKKVQGETIGTGDVSTLSTALGKADGTALQDEPAFSTSKPIAEIIASAGDQTFLFAKKFSADQVTGLDDTAVLSYAKPLTEHPATSDNDVIAFAKALADHGFIAEAIDTLAVGKVFSDAYAASDVINTLGITKALFDTVTFTDDVDGAASLLDDQEMQFQKLTTDAASVVEQFYRQVGYTRAFSDSSAVADTTNLVTGKQLYDIPVATETLAMSFTRPRSDSALFGDANVVSSNKVVFDLTSSTDAGSLRSQGYSDFTYFEEDFVGASTTF